MVETNHWANSTQALLQNDSPLRLEHVEIQMQQTHIEDMWNVYTFLFTVCSGGQVFLTCPQCAPTCETVDSFATCSSSCRPGCGCPAGKVLFGEICVLPEMCPPPSKSCFVLNIGLLVCCISYKRFSCGRAKDLSFKLNYLKIDTIWVAIEDSFSCSM